MSGLRGLVVVCATLTAGCAVFGKADPVEVRYFTPMHRADTTASVDPATPPLALRLRRVEGASHLQRMMVYRGSEHEVSFIQTQRWTEEPHEYLRVALARALFEQRGVQRSLSAGVPTLEVELRAFEVSVPDAQVRVEVVLLLHHGKQALLERTIEVHPGVKDPEDPEAVAQELGEALRAVVSASVDEVISALKTHAASGDQG